MAQLQRAAELDPLSMVINIEVAEVLDALGRNEEAGARVEKMVATYPDAELMMYYAILHYLPLGDFDRVSEIAASALDKGTVWSTALTAEEARLLVGQRGDPDGSREDLITLAESTRRGELAVGIYRGLGQDEQTLQALERVVAVDSLAAIQYLPAVMMTLGPELGQDRRAQAAFERMRVAR
jgi:tetratricopeptide (TPR) repeat protein